MALSNTEPQKSMSSVEYLLGRILASCAVFQEVGGWSGAEEAFSSGIDFGEREVFKQRFDDQTNAWVQWAQLDQMPVAVVSTNQFNSVADGGDCERADQGIVAAHVYIRHPDGQDSHWTGPNFYGTLISEIWDQKAGVAEAMPLFSDLTLPITNIEVIGPTRTPILERGKDGENDYWDAVFMIHWSDQ